MKRRTFVKNTALAAGALSFPNILRGGINQHNKINIGVIGCNGMGWSDTNSLLKMPEVDLVGICDVDEGVIAKRLMDYQKLRTNKPTQYGDYRELLNDKKLDAVVIGTPDHWHCKQMVDAVRAGKHVYVEKPVANTIEECGIMVDAARDTGKVVQTGQWQRSGPHYRKAREIVQSGVLGKIRVVKTWAYQGWMGAIPVVPDGPVPEGVDYKTWLGPAPARPFNQNRFHFNFRWFWDYAGGLMTDWGVHEIDIALWIMEEKAPISVVASGGKLAFPDDASETPDTLQAIYQYIDFNMLWEHATGIDYGPYGRREGIAFIGNNGTLVVDRSGLEVLVERESIGYSNKGEFKMSPVAPVTKPDAENYLDMHTQNFVAAMKANDPGLLNTPIDSGSIAAINAQMGNIAFKTGEKVYWDQEAGKFKNNPEANQYLMANYQNGWKVSR